MKKRLLSFLILVTMLFTMLPVDAMTAVFGNNGNTMVNTVQGKAPSSNPFKDVREDSWYYDAVQYARINGFFSGINANTFDPDGTMTRGMFVTVLGRMAGVDQTAYTDQSIFSDVPADAYYAPYVAWAAKHGITTGIGNGNFDPNGLINREQMAVFFVRYFEAFGIDYDTGVNITTVPQDLDKVSPWAREMVLKLWRTGLLAGDGVNFDPAGNASRAQAATLCMRTDKAVKTWYSEPGVPSGRVSVEPDAGQEAEEPGSTDDSNSDGDSKTESGSSSGKSSGGSNCGDSDSGSKTTYYKVEFVTDENTKTDKKFASGTLLSTMPNGAQPTGKVFLGWYYDKERIKPVSSRDRLTGNTTLYAKFADANVLEESGAPDFVSALDQKPDFSVSVKKTGSAPVLGIDFKFRNITSPDKTPESGTLPEDMLNAETVKVEGSNGVWVISSAGQGFTPGHTYQIELINDDVTYDDSLAAIADFKEIYGHENVPGIRFFNFSIEKDGTLNLTLNDGIKYIRVDELSEADRLNLMDYAGLYLATTDSEGNTTYTANNGSGSFTYTGNEKIQEGDTVAIYAGTKPTERLPEKGTGNKTDNGDVSYVKITKVDGSTYHYAAADAVDVLFKPDILPVDVDENDGTTGWEPGGVSVIIDNSMLDFSDTMYESMGLGSETTVDVGDFLAFYTGDFGDADAQDLAYAKIVEIIFNGDGTTTIIYTEVSLEEVLSAMDLYDETQLSEEEIQAIIDENKDEIQRIIEAQLMESNFFDEAGVYLAELALSTDEIKDVFGDDLTLSDCIITYSDGTPIGAQELQLMGNIIDNDQDGKKPKVSVSISPRMAHFDPILAGLGFRAEVAVTYKFKIQKKGMDSIVEVDLTAFFEQEFTVSFKVSGGAVWKKKWIFPYIADYRLTGHLDLGTYTGIGITATAKLKEAKEPWGMPWPNSAREAAATKKIFSLSESIKGALEEAEKFIPEEEATGSGGLAEKYARLMEDANEEWVDLFTANLLDLRSAVDPLHILAFGLKVDFVVSANLNVALGLTFQYENFKRHSFTLFVLSKNGESETIDLSTNGYQFDFYVIGHLGLRAGLRVKVTAGLFSTKLAAIGIQFEAGAYIRIWGYFYYHVENWKINGVQQKNSSHSGALLVEVGAYIDVKFIAEALNGKYSYQPSIYAKEWPLLSAGQRENVYDFAYEEDPTIDILNVNTYTLPKSIFDMYWMDLKTGQLEDNSKNFDSNTAVDGDDEKHFAVELIHPDFSYNPVNNMITVNTASGDVELSSEMNITWKGAPLSYSSDVIKRTITLNWSNEANAGTIAFDSNGGSAVPMLRLLAETALSGRMPAAPERPGYSFAGWYTDQALTTPFTATAMPKGNTTLYAKWTPNTVGYTVEHYQQAPDGQYILQETEKTLSGLVGTLTAAAAKPYTGFTAQHIKQQTIEPDGSTRVEIYYDRNLYDLTFVYGNGNNDITLKIPYGSAIIKPSNPVKDGYTFAGWSADIPDTMPANNLSFTAMWTANPNIPYTVKHYKETLDRNYVLEQTEAKTGASGQETLATARAYTSFTALEFNQKTVLPDGSTIVEIYYNRNINNLTWDVNGGNTLTGSYTYGNVKYGTPIKNPETPTRTGFFFDGWYKDAELSMPLEDNATMPDMALTLYAKWTVNQYTITFNSNGGSEVAPITQDYGTAVNAPTAPTKAGHIFAGWQLDGEDYTFSTMLAENITLVARWEASDNIPYTVEHYVEELDGSYSSIPYEIDSLTGVTDITVTADAKSYPGFSLDLSAPGTISSGIVTAGGNLVLKLYYSRNYYTVSWNGNGGNLDTYGATTGSVRYGAPISKPANEPTRIGYTFNGWSGYSENMTMPAGNITFTANWNINQYTITFDSNGGSEVAPITQDYNTAVNAPTAPTKAGYIFAGWQLDGEDYTFSTMPVENITLTAMWEPLTTIKYTVEHYLEELLGGYPSAPNAMELLNGTTGELVTANAKEYTGFTYTPTVAETVYSGIVTVDSGLVLKLYYNRNYYTVSWDGNGGNLNTDGATTGSVKYGAPISKPANEPTRIGYTFNGWSDYYESMTMPAENITFTANWSVNQYTIIFNSNGGSEVAPITQDYNTAVDAPSAPTRTGYTFAGWQLNGEDYTFSTMPAENIILTAKWTPNTYTVEFDPNGGVGFMQEQIFTYDIAQSLIPNEFTNAGYTFMGWNTSPDGSGTSYPDRVSVKNLTGGMNETVTLYALWLDINTEFSIWVDGVRVTGINAGDVLNDGGTVSYNAIANTLTLNGAEITKAYTGYAGNKAGIYAENGLNIQIIGTNSVDIRDIDMKDDPSRALGIFTVYGSLSFFGESLSDNLTVISADVEKEYSNAICVGTFSNGSINIANCTLFAKSGNSNGDFNNLCAGIYSMKDIRIENAVVTGIGGVSSNTSNWGIGLDGGGKITIINSDVTAYVVDNGRAMNRVPQLDADAQVTASTNNDGSSPVPYNPNDIGSYKYLEIRR